MAESSLISESDLQRVAAYLKERGAREVYVFGSVATGEADAYSDLDLAVTGLAPENFFSALGGAMCLIRRDIDLIDLDRSGDFGPHLREHGSLRRVA